MLARLRQTNSQCPRTPFLAIVAGADCRSGRNFRSRARIASQIASAGRVRSWRVAGRWSEWRPRRRAGHRVFLSPLLLLPPPTFNGYLSLPNGTFTPAFGCCALLCVPLVALRCLALVCAAVHYMNCTAWVAPPRLHSMRCTAYIAPRGLQEIGVRGPRWLTFVHAISRKQPIRTTRLALPEGRGCK